MTAPTSEVVGADRLARTMAAAGRDLADLDEPLAVVGRIIADAARTFAPRRTGRLAASVRFEGDRDRVDVLAGSAVVPYAGVITFGWPAHGISGNRYAVRAAESTEPQWTRTLVDGVQDVLDQVKGI